MCEDLGHDFITNDQILMALCFVSKEADLLKSLCILIESHQDRDGQLIARYMVEGLTHLLLASKDPKHAHKWRAYALVHDFKLIQEKDAKHETFDESYRSEIVERLKTEGEQFYKDKAKKALKAGKLLPQDPYRNENVWAGINVADICDQLNRRDLYDFAYKDISKWVHWSLPGIVSALKLIWICYPSDT